jgi:enoyl-CoA hydratase/carnithine racemase
MSVILEELNGGVLTLTLNRPERKNAVTRDMTALLNAMLRRAADAPEVRAVVLTGAGDAFCAGGDMHAIAGAAGSGDQAAGPGRCRWSRCCARAPIRPCCCTA